MTCSSGCSGSGTILFRGNDQILVLNDVVSEVTGLPVPGASVTATLQDSDGNNVVGLTDLEMDESGSPFLGNYSGQILGDTFNPPVGNDYTLIVTVTSVLGNLKLTNTVTVLDRTQ
jgi:hypothetical protein